MQGWLLLQGKAVLGEDFSMALGGGADADESNLFDRGGKESVAWSGSGGLLLDASVTGGNRALYGSGVTAAQVFLLLRQLRNNHYESKACCHNETSRSRQSKTEDLSSDSRGDCPAQILEGSDAPDPPATFKPVYELINSVVARADSDPRKFSGFEKHWAPQVSPIRPCNSPVTLILPLQTSYPPTAAACGLHEADAPIAVKAA